MKVVILAGGSGTRLWPISRDKKPKQVAPLWKGKTLLEETVNRLKGLVKPQDIYLLMVQDLYTKIKKEIPSIKKRGINIIIEPAKRDTGPAMAWAAARLVDKFPDEPLLFLASDHYIRDNKELKNAIRVQEKLVKKTGKLLDIAIIPEFPSTAFGYTKIGKLYKEIDGVEVYNFLGHVEKPEFNEAKKLIQSGKYLWHANFYMWTPKKLMEAYKKHARSIYQGVMKAKKKWSEGKKREAKEIFQKIKKLSIDYAVTEKLSSKDVLIIKGEFGWSDIGSWSALHEEQMTGGDSRQNVIDGDWVGFDTSNCLIITKSQKKLIATAGLDDMVIIDTPDALLVCPKGRSQDVKKIVEELKKRNKKKFI